MGSMIDSPDMPDLAVDVSPADHALGPPDAAVTLAEYGDYECPDCLNAQPLVAELRGRENKREKTNGTALTFGRMMSINSELSRFPALAYPAAAPVDPTRLPPEAAWRASP